MSKKHDAFKQVRLNLKNAAELRRMRERLPYQPSLAALVNQIVHDWINAQTTKGNNQ